jgi:hypothetical protein
MRLSITTNADIVRQGLESFAGEIPAIGRRGIYNTMRKIVAIVDKPGKTITYPVKWDTPKQRKAFFATDGWGRGIPTGRTGTYAEGWEIVRLDNGYRIENRTPYAKHISGGAYGNTQSRIHKDRWVLLRDASDKAIAQLPEEIQDELIVVARRERLV